MWCHQVFQPSCMSPDPPLVLIHCLEPHSECLEMDGNWAVLGHHHLAFAHQESEISKITCISPLVFGSVLTFPLSCVATLWDAQRISHYWGWELAIRHGHRAEADVLRFSFKLMSVCQGSTAKNQHDCASMWASVLLLHCLLSIKEWILSCFSHLK